MNVTEALKAAGFTPEKSSIGDRLILVGTYKAAFYDCALMEDKGYGQSVYAQFKVTETLEGISSTSKFPEFKAYYSLAPEKIASKRKGLAKLINGFFSIGVEVNTDNLMDSLSALKGTELFISGYKEEPRKQVDGVWQDDPDGDIKQGFTFLTQKNAEKKVQKAGSPF